LVAVAGAGATAAMAAGAAPFAAALEIVGDRFERGAKPKNGTAHLFLPKIANRRTQIIRRRHKGELLLLVKGHGPGRPARAKIEILFRIIRHFVIAQVHQTHAIGLDEMVQDFVLFQHLHVVSENAQNGALPRLVARHDLDEFLVRGLEVLDLDEIVFDQLRAQQAVGAHQERTVFFRHVGSRAKLGSGGGSTRRFFRDPKFTDPF
jgi:hypothetical protein